jgi:hypothetical protein
MEKPSLSHTINIMLTPQFYTIKKENLPLKYLYQAKKIAPSLFDGFLEDFKKYDYFVYREDNSWIFIAYNMEVINEFLSSKGIKSEQIDKIFFTQQALDSFTAPVLLGDKEALISLNDTVVVIPQTVLQGNSETVSFSTAFTPSTGLTLQRTHASALNKKQTIGLTVFFTLFALIFFVEGWRYSHSSQKIQEDMQILLGNNPFLQSQYSRDSIAAKYKTIDKKERRKREIVKTLAGMIFKGIKLSTFHMNEKSFSVAFICTDTKVAQRLVELAKKSEFNSARIITGNVVSIEEKL